MVDESADEKRKPVNIPMERTTERSRDQDSGSSSSRRNDRDPFIYKNGDQKTSESHQKRRNDIGGAGSSSSSGDKKCNPFDIKRFSDRSMDRGTSRSNDDRNNSNHKSSQSNDRLKSKIKEEVRDHDNDGRAGNSGGHKSKHYRQHSSSRSRSPSHRTIDMTPLSTEELVEHNNDNEQRFGLETRTDIWRKNVNQLKAMRAAVHNDIKAFSSGENNANGAGAETVTTVSAPRRDGRKSEISSTVTSRMGNVKSPAYPLAGNFDDIKVTITGSVDKSKSLSSLFDRLVERPNQSGAAESGTEKSKPSAFDRLGIKVEPNRSRPVDQAAAKIDTPKISDLLESHVKKKITNSTDTASGAVSSPPANTRERSLSPSAVAAVKSLFALNDEKSAINQPPPPPPPPEEVASPSAEPVRLALKYPIKPRKRSEEEKGAPSSEVIRPNVVSQPDNKPLSDRKIPAIQTPATDPRLRNRDPRTYQDNVTFSPPTQPQHHNPFVNNYPTGLSMATNDYSPQPQFQAASPPSFHRSTNPFVLANNRPSLLPTPAYPLINNLIAVQQHQQLSPSYVNFSSPDQFSSSASTHFQANFRPSNNDNLERQKYEISKRQKQSATTTYGEYRRSRIAEQNQSSTKSKTTTTASTTTPAAKTSVEDDASTASTVSVAPLKNSQFDDAYRTGNYTAPLAGVTENFKIPRLKKGDTVAKTIDASDDPPNKQNTEVKSAPKDASDKIPATAVSNESKESSSVTAAKQPKKDAIEKISNDENVLTPTTDPPAADSVPNEIAETPPPPPPTIESNASKNVEDEHEEVLAANANGDAENLPDKETNKEMLEQLLVNLLDPSHFKKNNLLALLGKVVDETKFKQIKEIIDGPMAGEGIENAAGAATTTTTTLNDSEVKSIVENTKPPLPDDIEMPGHDEDDRDSHDDVDRQSQQRKPAQKPRKKLNELQKLNEDIRTMFISDGVLTASGRRMCTVLKQSEEVRSTRSSKAAKTDSPASNISSSQLSGNYN